MRFLTFYLISYVRDKNNVDVLYSASFFSFGTSILKFELPFIVVVFAVVIRRFYVHGSGSCDAEIEMDKKQLNIKPHSANRNKSLIKK